jgi:hypothetical protein
MGLGNFVCWRLLSMSLQKSTKHSAGRSCQPHTILWLAAATATITPHSLFMDGAHFVCVCVVFFKSTRNSHSWKHQNWHELQNNFHFKFLADILCAVLGNYLLGPYLSAAYYRDFLRSEVPHCLEDVPFATRAQMRIWQDWVRSVLFWDFTQHRTLIPYQCFGLETSVWDYHSTLCRDW